MKNIILTSMTVIFLTSCSGGGGSSAAGGGGAGSGTNNGNLGQLNSVSLNQPLTQTDCTITGSTSQKLRVTKTSTTELIVDTLWYSSDTTCSSLTGLTTKLIYTIAGSTPLSTDNSFDNTSLSAVSKQVSVFGASNVNSYNTIIAYGFSDWVSGLLKNITCLKIQASTPENQRQPCSGAVFTLPVKYQNSTLTLDGITLQ